MKLVAGLGNIGDKYVFTRHNAGFMVIDKWAMMQGATFAENKKLKCLLAKFKRNGEDIIIIKPTTFMNLSGEAVRAVADYYLGTQQIARLKIGIGPQPPIPSEQFVLQNFYKSQLDILKPVLKIAVEGIEFYLDNDMQTVQNKYN